MTGACATSGTPSSKAFHRISPSCSRSSGPRRSTTSVLTELRRLYAPSRPFAYELATVESFPDAAWLAPVPAEPFHALVEIAREAFPALPPYGDPGHVVVPHCTIGTDDDPARVELMVRELRENLGPRLPIRCRADELVLLGEEPDGTWARREAFPLGGA